MNLTDDEQALLRHIAEAPTPVVASSFFHTIYPPSPDMGDEGPEQEAWTQRQIGLYGAHLALHDKGLVRVVEPANGERPDLVEATAAGRSALSA